VIFDNRKKKDVRKMILMKFLKEWNGHRPDTYQLKVKLKSPSKPYHTTTEVFLLKLDRYSYKARSLRRVYTNEGT
jgi:hypothetical protein